MALSKRARRMLAQGTREASHIERSDILKALQRAELPVFEPVVAFQQQFGGITYRIQGSNNGMTLGLFHPEIFAFTYNHRYYFKCGVHHVAPVGFYLDENGVLYVDERFPSPLAIASSVEKYIESDAMESELTELSFKWWQPLGEVAHNDNRLRQRIDLPIIAQASDAYTTWWGNQNIRVVQHVFWSSEPPQNRRVMYARTQSDAQQLKNILHDLLDKRVLSRSLFPWPSK